MTNVPALARAASNSQMLVQLIEEASQEAKGFNLITLDVAGLADIADYLVIISGRSDRHTQGIANRIVEELSRRGMVPASTEGFELGHWVLLDYEDVVVHVFYEPTREHYDLESLWAKAPRLRLVHTPPEQEQARL